jgi:hypothetical protein
MKTHLFKKLGLFVLGVVVGTAITVPAIRISRNPDTPSGKLRTGMGIPATSAISAASATSAASAKKTAEEAYLFNRYGPAKQSQFQEEWIVRDYFHDKRGGIFVDVGAGDYKAGSNTWFLEHELE